MAEEKVPYVTAYGNIDKALERIRPAQTPARFTQDFLATKLNLKGGSARPVIPFLKRTGFLASDGSPTELYRRFRNDSQRGGAAREALRTGYRPLYEINEYVHDTSDAELKGIVVQATGLSVGSSTVKAILGSFKALKKYATFDIETEEPVEEDAGADGVGRSDTTLPLSQLRLGYTINLNLPSTSDVAVFDAIFKSLREHILR
jgi:Family of unknown function (DUF5343)